MLYLPVIDTVAADDIADDTTADDNNGTKNNRIEPNPVPSADSSRNSSLDRTHRKNHDHIMPTTLTFDTTVIGVQCWQERFRAWIIEQCKPDDPDKDLTYLFQLVLSLVDIKWFNTLHEHPDCKDAKMEKTFKAMDDVMLIKQPIYPCL